MLNSILNYSRFALLGIAMAFVINPYPVFADEMYDQMGDEDNDRLYNVNDVCIEESYEKFEHQMCLSQAGVVVIAFGGAGSSDELEARLNENHRELTGQDLPSAGEVLMWVIDRFFLQAGVPENHWDDLNIETCMNLETYYKHLKSYGDTLADWSKIGIKIPLIGRRDPTYSTRKAVSMLLEHYSAMYLSAYDDTKSAHDQLCGKNRLKKKRQENPEQ